VNQSVSESAVTSSSGVSCLCVCHVVCGMCSVWCDVLRFVAGNGHQVDAISAKEGERKD
jgi:hypothetical protein